MNTKQTEALKLALHHIEAGAHNRRYIRHVIREALAEESSGTEQPGQWIIPQTAGQISDFIGSDYVWREHKVSDIVPHKDDQYCVTAHDLISAFERLADHIGDANKMAEQPGNHYDDVRESMRQAFEQSAQQINPETRTKDGLKYSPNYVAGYNDGLKAAQQQEQVAWRELCRRLYVELFHCDQQMMATLDEDGEPVWTQGKTVRDVLVDAKAALDTSPPYEATPLAIQRSVKPWVGLTEHELSKLVSCTQWRSDESMHTYAVRACRAIEAKLREKNA